MTVLFRRIVVSLLAPLVLVALIAGCGASGSPSGANGASQGKFVVVAGENFWGSIATQPRR